MSRIVFVGLILCAIVPVVLYGDAKEPKTGVTFSETMNHDGTELILAGVGVRTRMIVKVYAGALYIDAAAKSALVQYKSQASNPRQAAYDAIADGNFARMFVLHFVRDVDSGKITDAFREGLAKSIDLKAPDVQQDANAFLSVSKIDMKEGQEMKIYLKGDEITVITPSGSSQPIKDAKLTGAVARIWLGKDPISKDLKKGMLNRLQQIL